MTPPSLYFNRRQFMRGAVLALSVAATGGLYRAFNHKPRPTVATAGLEGIVKPSGSEASGFQLDGFHDPLEDITHYNNFYEFTTDKEEVAAAAAGFSTKGWKIAVDGLVKKPQV